MTQDDLILAECPFCGGAVRWCGEACDDPHTCHQITCDNCHTQFDVNGDTEINISEDMSGTRRLMAARWNRRAHREPVIRELFADDYGRVFINMPNDRIQVRSCDDKEAALAFIESCRPKPISAPVTADFIDQIAFPELPQPISLNRGYDTLDMQQYARRYALESVAACRARMVPEWRPIESAPKDTDALLLFPFWGAIRGHWCDDKYARTSRPYWRHDRERTFGTRETRGNQPTRWMPLPEPMKGGE